MICVQCGNLLAEGAGFCPVCGARVQETAPSEPSGPPPPPPQYGAYGPPPGFAGAPFQQPPGGASAGAASAYGAAWTGAPALQGAKGISISEMVKFGWRTIRDQPGLIVGLFAIAALIQVVPTILSAIGAGGPGLAVLQLIWTVFVGPVLAMGLFKISLKLCDGQRPSFEDLYSSFPLLLKYWGATILLALIVIGGAILLIFPAFVWGLTFGLAPFFVVDRELGPIAALKASFRTTSGAKWDLLGLFFVSYVITVIGLLCLLVGVLVTYPLVTIAWAQTYRRLLAQTNPALLAPGSL